MAKLFFQGLSPRYFGKQSVNSKIVRQFSYLSHSDGALEIHKTSKIEMHSLNICRTTYIRPSSSTERVQARCCKGYLDGRGFWWCLQTGSALFDKVHTLFELCTFTVLLCVLPAQSCATFQNVPLALISRALFYCGPTE